MVAPDGFPIAVQESGDPSGPPLLLLAGQANNHHWWDRLRGGFDDHRVVTFDWRGTGGSRGPVGEWSTTSFAADAVSVLDGLGIGRTSVYATSMGGRVAQVLAASYADHVDRLVLACTSPGGRHAQERSADVRRALAEPDLERRLATLQSLFYTEAWPHGPRESRLLGDPAMDAAESRAHLRASARHDAWDLLPSITAPTLVLHGTDDAMVPASNAPMLAGRIPDAAVWLHEGGRHGFFEEFADVVTPRVRDFLAG